MADIDIERKGGMAWLWWVLGLAALALLAWMLLAGGDDEEQVPGTFGAAEMQQPVVVDTMAAAGAAGAAGTAGAAGAAAIPAIGEYMTQCAERAPDQMGLEHQYTSDCLRRLVGSVEALMQRPALSGVNAQAELATARQSAERLTASAQTADHAGMTREAFTSVAALLARIQSERFPDMAGPASQLGQTAQSISATQPLLDQRSTVQDYFRQAGTLLNGMASAG